MPKYIVTCVDQIRRTRTYEVEANTPEEAEDIVFDDGGTLVSEYEKNFDGDSWVEEVK